MRALCIGLTVCMTSMLMATYSDEPVPKTEEKLTIHDIERQIQLLKDNIEKYNNLAQGLDRKAGSLQSHDYTGAREAATLRDECRSIAKDLEGHLGTLEAQRAQMMERSKQSYPK